MKNQNKTPKKYTGLKFKLLNTPVNYDIVRTYSTITNNEVKTDEPNNSK